MVAGIIDRKMLLIEYLLSHAKNLRLLNESYTVVCD